MRFLFCDQQQWDYAAHAGKQHDRRSHHPSLGLTELPVGELVIGHQSPGAIQGWGYNVRGCEAHEPHLIISSSERDNG
jgi:hypothetical protein